jgi:uncharacterized membrane protein (UPF0182 family)
VPGSAPEVPTPIAAVPPAAPGVPSTLSGPKTAALQDVETALGAVQEAQKNGNFAEYGDALQRLDDAMKKYEATK